MSVKVSVGVGDAHEDRALLEELRRNTRPRGSSRGEGDDDARAPGWPMQARDDADDADGAEQSAWAW